MEPTIGARIKKLRTGAMTQQELATAAEVSVDLIRKLEQGRRHTASIGSLHRIARALDVDTAELLAKPTTLQTGDTESGVVAIRRVLTSVDDLIAEPDADGELITVEEAERTVNYLWGAYWAGRYDLLGSLLPEALTQLRAVTRAASADARPHAMEALASGLQVAGDTLVHLGQTDAAFLAVREALTAARDGDNAFLSAAVRASVAWQMLVQGRLRDSEQVALTAAAAIEPRGKVTPSHLAVYGILTVTAATAVAREGRTDRTTELLDVSREYAGRLGTDQAACQTTFGPAKVAMMAVDCHVVLENFPEALKAARHLDREAPLSLATRARHLADVAYSQTRLGQDSRALDTLLTMESIAPDWIKYQTLPRQTVHELIERDRRRVHGSRLRELARRLGADRSA
ncbi:MAG TPA: helix-turn-helix transcriptional regulator [Pseudonocardiaceae bacterium]|nr:helix-turn-helix transcriptional regulator [Pseudonocardiaceae bacterium]